jgi:hypothetical protein
MNKRYFHGSYDKLPVGTILVPQEDYEKNWQDTDFYTVLEQHRPSHMLRHKEAVFLCDNADDIDNAGGATDWLFTVEPLSDRVERHDLNWGSEVSALVSDHADESAIQHAAEMYWSGDPSNNEVVWEYLTPAAVIVAVEPY